jgi:hypothetical protein
VGLILFRDFVFGNRVLLYKDIGSDSLNVFYPNYVLRSDYLRQVGTGPLWFVLALLVEEFMAGACASFTMYSGLTHGVANMLRKLRTTATNRPSRTLPPKALTLTERHPVSIL